MLNIHELERQWRAYKKSVYKPYLIGFSTLAVLAIVTAVFISLSKKDAPVQAKNVTPSAPIATVKPEIQVIEEVVPAAIKPQVVQESDAVLSSQSSNKNNPIVVPKAPLELKPSFAFMNDIVPEERKSKKVKKHKKSSAKHTKKRPAHRKDIQAETTPQAPHPVSMTSTSSDSKMQALTKRFAQSKNPALGIVIARLYFEKKAYALAYKYALDVNAVDESNIHSWLIAARSLYFLGKKVDAVNLLNNYIQKTHSNSAQKLLRQIQSGNVQ